jgi:hypothetical protein
VIALGLIGIGDRKVPDGLVELVAFAEIASQA